MTLQVQTAAWKPSPGRYRPGEKEAWLAILHQAGLTDHAANVSGCATQVWHEVCTKDLGHRAVKRSNHCNDRNFCPPDAYRYAQGKAEEAYEFIKANVADWLPFKLYLVYLDLTVPHELDLLGAPEIRRMAHELLAREGLETAGLEVVQEEGSEDPTKRHLHEHIVALNAGLKTEFGRTTPYRMRPYFDVARLRLEWTSIVNARLPEGRKVANTDLFVRYNRFDNKGSCLHRLRYMYRLAAWDVFKATVREPLRLQMQAESGAAVAGWRGQADADAHQGVSDSFMFNKTLGPAWLGSFPEPGPAKGPWRDFSKLGELLTRRRPRPTWFGYLANSRRYKLKGVLYEEATSWSSIKARLRERHKRCQVCGAELRLATPEEEIWLCQREDAPPPDGREGLIS